MPVIVNDIRKGFYLDSVALMRFSREVAALPGVEECGMMMGTPANMRIMADARVLDDTGRAAAPGDLVIAIRAVDAATAETARTAATKLLDAPRKSSRAAAWTPRTLRSAVAAMPEANLALVSVPGAFATAEALKAIRRGLNVMIFSDNVPVADEVMLKQEAAQRGVLVMGPDCGTAIIDGVPLAFANVVPRGDIGIIGASGTGMQEVTSLIANHGGGISHAIGTGGRDLKADVGGLTTLAAIDLLDADPATRQIVIISKPPAADIAARILDRVARSKKPFVINFLGGTETAMPANARAAVTLEDAARLARRFDIETPTTTVRRKGLIRGLFAGGTLCAEAQIIARAAGLAVTSNVPVPGAKPLDAKTHTLIDLGDDEYTQGRPHPMIEPAVRDKSLAAALCAPDTAVILIDCVLGFGGHSDPARHIAQSIKSRQASAPPIIASVTGTDADPQRRAAQVATLTAAGVAVAPSNAAAMRRALAVITN
jgi:FdrA protein